MRTKLSERNMFNVMGKINTFFKKDVVKVKDKDHYFDKNYTYYPGNCHEHKIRVDRRKMEKEGKPFYLTSNVLLAIGHKYSYDVIPLFPGDIVEIKGSKMVIRTSIDGSFYTKTFIQKESTDEEKHQIKKSFVGEQLMWFCDDMMWIDMIDESWHGDAIRLRNELSYKFSHCIDEADFSQSGKKVFDFSTKELDCFTLNDVKFQLEVNLDAVNEGNINESLAILIDGQKEYDIFGVVSRALSTDSDDSDDLEEF